ncbi:hypothetical protein J7E64_25575 [Priestia megaterium]|nr:hypothetical protein [Priestia megaterium]
MMKIMVSKLTEGDGMKEQQWITMFNDVKETKRYNQLSTHGIHSICMLLRNMSMKLHGSFLWYTK